MESKTTQYPRVLIINGQSIYKDNATGITLRKLWESWPRNCVMEVYADIDQNVDAGSNKIIRIALPQRLVDKILHSSMSRKINSGIKTQQVKGSNGVRLSAKQKLRQLCACLPMWLPFKINVGVMRRIEAFKPDIIYTLGGSVSVLQLVHKISHRFGIGTVIHFMDNWVEHRQWANNAWLNPYNRALIKQLNKCIDHCQNIIAISPSMAKAYTQRFGIPCEVLMNMVDIGDAQPCVTNQTDGIIKFIYAGGLHLERWKALKTLAQSIQRHCGNGVLQIYTSDANRALYEDQFSDLPVKFMPMVPHDKVGDVLRTASVLVHAEVSSPTLEGFFKHSVSTKVPEYMATGRPFLFFAPRTLGAYEYLAENRAAILADTEISLDAVVADIASGKNYTEEISNAWRLAKQNHSSEQGWERLRHVMIAGAYNKKAVADESL